MRRSVAAGGARADCGEAQTWMMALTLAIVVAVSVRVLVG